MSRKFSILAFILIVAMLAPLFPACTKSPAPTAYTAVIPAVLQAGSKQAISIALFSGKEPTHGSVNVILSKDGQEISRAQGNIKGNGMVQLNVPEIAEGDYTLQVKGNGFQDEAQVKVENKFIIFLETDKPIYKPGQTVRMRVMTLNPELRPATGSVTVEVLDAKGIKIFRTETTTDKFGMAGIDLPISTEPNLGTWKITAVTPETQTQLDIRVEEYVLPKYEVKVDLPKDWFLVSEPIKGRVTSTYSFGKPVKGNLEIKAVRYVGTWEQYAELQLDIDGEAEFTIPPAQYVAGVPAAQGSGNVRLEFTVKEASTGYQEKADTLLTIADSSSKLTIIPSGSSFKPGLPYSFLVISETPDNKMVDTSIAANVRYLNKSFKEIKEDRLTADTEKGKALFEINPPDGAVALTIECFADEAQAYRTIEAAYSPSGNFIHLEQISEGTPQVGEDIKFYVYSTREAVNFYYEVISRGTVVYSDFTNKNGITFRVTPAMAPSAKLLVYQVLPNAEIAADYLPFESIAEYPQELKLETSVEEAGPGSSVRVQIQAEGESEVGLAAVDRSVFILAENRMNLQQVFDKLDELYMNPQAELHEVSIYEGIMNRGASEVFRNAGVIVLSNNTIPDGKKYESEMWEKGLDRVLLGAMEDAAGIAPPMPAQAAPGPASRPGDSDGLAEVQRIRQFFPETWIWDTIKTDASGKASVNYTVPDSITTWMLRAVALSKDKGLGIAEKQLTVFQPFFLTVDLPYSTIRGEEFPVSVAVYNYLDQPQQVTVQIEKNDWFDLLDDIEKTIRIDANDIGGARFKIRPTGLGTGEVKITARSSQAADAVIKTIIVEPEGAAKETVQNISLANGQVKEISTRLPDRIVEGSARAYLAVTSSYLTQTIDGLESLIQMPFGCGEQNMIIFAPDVYITRYLKQSGQLKPEIMAKAEKLMLTGYQRELTYRRSDGSFSAFGESDKEGSLWLTAFVLKCFSEAKGLIYIDQEVLDKASDWVMSKQNPDGSFESVGFVHHQEMVGGMSGKTALTAYVTIALLQAGEKSAVGDSVSYLERQLDEVEDPYTVALIAYALALADSDKKEIALEKLMALAKEDENGLYWGDDQIIPLEQDGIEPGLRMPPMPQHQTSSIEATAYATLALIKQEDNLNASRAAKWLVSKRNAYGGFGSTQDTILSLQALIEYSASASADVDLTVKVESAGKARELKINRQNFDILQIVEIPENDTVTISVRGQGEAIGQIVQRYNVPEVEEDRQEILTVDVNYNADRVAVNDEVEVEVSVSFNPPVPMEAGMTVVDVAVPTGFAAVRESIDQASAKENRIKRYEISGRKVIFYIENLFPGDELAFDFMVQALYPVKAKGVVSQAYSYYQPEIKAESLGRDISVVDR